MCSLLEKSFLLLTSKTGGAGFGPCCYGSLHTWTQLFSLKQSRWDEGGLSCPAGHKWTQHSALLLCQAALLSGWAGMALGGSGGSQIEGLIMQTQTLDSKIIPGSKQGLAATYTVVKCWLTPRQVLCLGWTIVSTWINISC